MHYVSTRDSEKSYNFKDIVISGTAIDGGLYIPNYIPKVNKEILANWKKLSYIDLAVEIISLFINDINKNDIKSCCKNAYLNFDKDILKFNKLENSLYLLELFHGPTLSFKDYALQFLGKMIDFILSQRRLHKQIIIATSGDTGPAAIYGFKDCKWVDIKVYYPKNGISKFQEEQMLSIKQDNIKIIALTGSFDRCQECVKEEFLNDKSGELMTVNSINFGRIIAQIVYYFWTYLKLEDKVVNFYVPTGNFGNIFAGFLAKKMGIDIKLNICVNENDTLYRFYKTGVYKVNSVIPTLSNAIDIANPSNFERILWYLSENDIKQYKDIKNNGSYRASSELLSRFRENFDVHRVAQDVMLKSQKVFLKKYNSKICPHTAVAFSGFLSHAKKDINGINVIVGTADSRKWDLSGDSNT
jgi:threonine synthase